MLHLSHLKLDTGLKGTNNQILFLDNILNKEGKE